MNVPKKRSPFMIWLLLIPGILLTLILALLIIGFLQPVAHTAGRSIVLKQKPDAVFAVIDKVDELPAWSTTVLKVERLPDGGNKSRSRQTLRGGWQVIATEIERQPPTRLIGGIEKEGGPLFGTWTYDFVRMAEGAA